MSRARRVLGLMLLTICGSISLLGAAAVIGPGVLHYATGRQVLAVTSGSMHPTFNTGALVIDKPATEAPKVGDIVSYRAGDLLITHRVIAAHPDGTYTTQGDANPIADGSPVTRQQIQGIVTAHVDNLGYFVAWGGTRQGKVALMAPLIVVLVVIELRNGLVSGSSRRRPVPAL